MQNTNQPNEWVNILSKGIITIPKKIREKVGIREGDIAKMRVEGNKIIIEPNASGASDFQEFTSREIERWVKEDKLPKSLVKKIDELWPELP